MVSADTCFGGGLSLSLVHSTCLHFLISLMSLLGIASWSTPEGPGSHRFWDPTDMREWPHYCMTETPSSILSLHDGGAGHLITATEGRSKSRLPTFPWLA